MASRWSYKVVEFKPGTWGGFKPDVLQDELNKLGAMGWELVRLDIPQPAIVNATAVFKKEI